MNDNELNENNNVTKDSLLTSRCSQYIGWLHIISVDLESQFIYNFYILSSIMLKQLQQQTYSNYNNVHLMNAERF